MCKNFFAHTYMLYIIYLHSHGVILVDLGTVYRYIYICLYLDIYI